MLRKPKKKSLKLKISKNFKNGKIGLAISCIATFPQDLALIALTFSEETRFTDDARTDRGTTDARVTAIALLTQ